MGIEWQSMESKALNKAYKLSDGRKGVLVKHIAPFVDAHEKLKRGDIIMKFDGIQIASDGTVPFRCSTFGITFILQLIRQYLNQVLYEVLTLRQVCMYSGIWISVMQH